MAEELIRLLGHVPADHRTNFVSLTSAWLGSSISRSLTDGELHAERIKLTKTLTRALVDLMAMDSEVSPRDQQPCMYSDLSTPLGLLLGRPIVSTTR
jgi:hypothetical protein